MKIKTALNSFAVDGSLFQLLPMYGTATPLQMGVAYVLQHSGEKPASNLLKYYCDDSGHITNTGISTIAGVIITMFKEQWDRRYEALISDYNPIENYNMTENEEGDDHKTYGEENEEYVYGAQKRSEKRGAQGGSSTQGEQHNSNENGISAFNSGGYANDRNGSEDLGSRSDSYHADAYTDEISSDRYTDSKSHSADDDTSDFRRELTRKGNIGVTTTQQMIEQELNLRAYRFFERMFEDIDSVIALRVYIDDDDVPTPTTGEENVLLTRLVDGVRISILEGQTVKKQIKVKDGVTPQFQLSTTGTLFVND